MRYDAIMEELASPGLCPSRAKELRAEADGIGTPTGRKGSSQRSAWFRQWEERLPEQMADDSCDDPESMLMRMLVARQGALGNMSVRRVRVPDAATLRRSVADHPALDWDVRMSRLAGCEGEVKQDDPTDGTSQVRFAAMSMTAWLPTAALISVGEGGTDRTPGGGGTPARGAAADPRARRDQLPPAPFIPRLGIDGRTRRPANLPRPEASAGGRGPSPANGTAAGPRLPAVSASGTRAPSPPSLSVGNRPAAADAAGRSAARDAASRTFSPIVVAAGGVRPRPGRAPSPVIAGGAPRSRREHMHRTDPRSSHRLSRSTPPTV